MTPFKHAARVFGIGLAAAVIATGCASSKPAGQAATPAAAPAVAGAGAAAAPMAKAGEIYAVVRGDCLWCISEQSNIYGNPYKWPLIFKANKNQIRDADLIYPGQELTIDRDASAAAIDAAIQHAKTRGAWSVGPIETTDTAFLAGSR